jgi:hypothetical protein
VEARIDHFVGDNHFCHDIENFEMGIRFYFCLVMLDFGENSPDTG